MRKSCKKSIVSCRIGSESIGRKEGTLPDEEFFLLKEGEERGRRAQGSGARGHGGGGNFAISRSNLRGEKNWGMGTQLEVDLLAIHQIHGLKSTKTHKEQQITKNWYGYFCGDFRNWAITNKIRLENKEGGSNFVRNHGS